MNIKFKELLRNPYFQITVVYLLTHFFMLILSGCWWDDWYFTTHDLTYVHTVAMESGRPEWDLLIPLCWSLPNNGRILIFFMFYLNSLFVYNIIKNCGLFNEKAALVVALAFSCIPVDDARILISNFPYSVGLFFFYLAFMLFTCWNKMERSPKKTVYRIGVLILFFLGFLLNSILAFYYILIAYLFVLELKKSQENNIFKKVVFAVKDTLIHYPDFFVLPFVYYFSNKILFPTYGDTFGKYNAITLSGLMSCFRLVPLSFLRVLRDLSDRCRNCLSPFSVSVVLIAVLFVLFRKDKQEEEEVNWRSSLVWMIYGLFVTFMGIFPYVTIRGHLIDTFGVKGRDAVLLPLGLGILFYALISLFKGKARKLLFTVCIVLGILSFNNLYIEWQKDYYYQLSLERLLNHQVIRDNDTFFLAELNETEIEAQRYYSLNVNAYHIYNDQTRFFVPKVSNLYILKSKEEVEYAIKEPGYSHMMNDYDPEDYYFDAVLNYKNYLSDLDTIVLKYYELTDKKTFDAMIADKGELEVTIVDDDFTIELLKEYDEGKLHSDQDVLDLLIEFGY